MNRKLRITAITLLAAGAAGAVLALIVRDQITRHQRDLFSPYFWRRLAALGFMKREETSVDNINLLRDFVAWEPSRLLRSRARMIVRRMEDEAGTPRLAEIDSEVA